MNDINTALLFLDLQVDNSSINSLAFRVLGGVSLSNKNYTQAINFYKTAKKMAQGDEENFYKEVIHDLKIQLKQFTSPELIEKIKLDIFN